MLSETREDLLIWGLLGGGEGGKGGGMLSSPDSSARVSSGELSFSLDLSSGSGNNRSGGILPLVVLKLLRLKSKGVLLGEMGKTVVAGSLSWNTLGTSTAADGMLV